MFISNSIIIIPCIRKIYWIPFIDTHFFNFLNHNPKIAVHILGL